MNRVWVSPSYGQLPFQLKIISTAPSSQTLPNYMPSSWKPTVLYVTVILWINVHKSGEKGKYPEASNSIKPCLNSLLECTTVYPGGSLQAFLRKVPTPSSGSKSKPRNQEAAQNWLRDDGPKCVEMCYGDIVKLIDLYKSSFQITCNNYKSISWEICSFCIS
jgi:hypothetical protein